MKKIKLSSLRYGSNYGGWWIPITTDISTYTLISAGVGTDVSFDVELLNKGVKNVIFVDPTCESLKHIEDVKKNVGRDSIYQYSKNGRQDVNSYNLFNIKVEQLTHLKKALWVDSIGIELFKPINQEHVSYSVISDGRLESQLFDSITYEEIVTNLENKNLILKMDIEGAELDCIPSILKSQKIPPYLLVEFDFKRKPSVKNLVNFAWVLLKLRKFNYACYKVESLNYHFRIDS